MILKFSKYHGTGNDFIIIDNRNIELNPKKEWIEKICNRRFGIGADGLMLLEKSRDFDFSMKYYNADGNEGTMCGNGGRCIVAFASSLGIIKKIAKFTAIDGKHSAEIIDNNTNEFIVDLKMQDVQDIKICDDHYFINTGSPHYVSFVENLEKFDVFNEGRKIRLSKEFAPDGTNVNFVEIKGENIFVRTYERGVEDETYSCGTGVTASAIAFYLRENKVVNNILTRGGKLSVKFEKEGNSFTKIHLIGPTNFVFIGECRT
ncbi:MAG: diaminopimelate epimerase [Bacteroidales bacterium]|nr:diaminopimelate epimerase [Bacteroidales bacterium]